MMKLSHAISIACLGLLISNITYADDWYQVEVMVFEYTKPNQSDIELWDNHPGEPDWKQGVYLTDEATAKARRQQELKSATPEEGPPTSAQSQAAGHEPAPSTSTDVPNQSFVSVEEIITGTPDHSPSVSKPVVQGPLAFVSLPSSQFTMGNIESKLNKQGGYRILTHVAWRQPSLGSNQLESVHITGGPLLDQDATTGPRYQFDGLITLKTSRFLHLDVDAVLRERDAKNVGGKFDSPADLGLLENKNDGNDRIPVYQIYRLTQSQRVRTNKLYYFDHPLMGMIIKISPYGG